MKEAIPLIKNSKQILLISHQDPDGDSIGSMILLKGYCQKINPQSSIIMVADPKHKTSLNYFFEKYNIQSTAPKADLIILVDTSTTERIYPQGIKPQINIDHHYDNSIKTGIDIIDGKAASTGIIIYRACLEQKIPLDLEMAEGLYLSIATDTGNFTFANTSAEVFAAAQAAVQAGIEPVKLANQINQVSLAEMKALAQAILQAESFFDDKLIIGIADKELDNRLLIDQLRKTPKVEIAAVLVPKDGYIKLSLRAKGNQDVSKIAHDFGGGGHQQAAAGKINTSNLETAKKILVDYCVRKKIF